MGDRQKSCLGFETHSASPAPANNTESPMAKGRKGCKPKPGK